jgi:hypothetical protein
VEIESASMIESVELEARIISAWADDAKSADVSRLLPEVEAAAAAADAAAAQARQRALDPTLSRDADRREARVR